MSPFYSIQVWINVVSESTFSVTFGEAGLKVESSQIYNHLSEQNIGYEIDSGWNFYQMTLYSEKFVNKLVIQAFNRTTLIPLRLLKIIQYQKYIQLYYHKLIMIYSTLNLIAAYAISLLKLTR